MGEPPPRRSNDIHPPQPGRRMTTPPVHWHEGLFLRPHHFQAAERYVLDQARVSERFDTHYNWGVRSVDIDAEAIKNYRFVVHRLEARTRDGTLVVIGPDTPIAPLDLRPIMERSSPGAMVDVLLAVPMLQIGRENTGTADNSEVRYHVDSPREPLPDENSGQNPRPVQFRRLNAKLVCADQNTTGFDTFPLARLERSAAAAAPPQMHPWFIPPCLACDGWPGLGVGVLGQIYNRIGNMVKQLAVRVRDQRITFDSNAPEDRKIFERLRALNEASATLHIYAQAQGVHPLPAYLELLRIAGKLAVFSKDCTLPDDMPAYDHDDLGRCFYWAKRYIDDLLSADFSQGFEMRPFIGTGLRMGVAMEPAWLAPAAQILVGVESALPADECRRLLTGKLNMKIGAAERVDEIFKLGQRGLDFLHVANPPRVLPPSKAITYFQINRDVSKDEWAAVGQTYNLAIRMNERLLTGTIEGRQDVTISADGKTTTLRFTLYVVPPEAAGRG
jgi:type VI secretion system protein ImpJ